MSADARRPEAARRHAAGRTALTLVGGPLALSVAALLIITLASAAADNPYPADGRGHDISYPQCTSVLPEAQSFAVIGVTGGRPFQENPCLTNEFAWATLTSMGPSLYMNISAALGSHADMGNTGPMGTCQPDDTPCIAYNYGFNAASYAYAYANASHAQAQNWWLDVETANSWWPATAYNQRSIQGAADFLSLAGLTVGVYSTSHQWNLIAGSYTPGLPVWYATAVGYAGAPAYCSDSYNFAGGGVWLVQYYGGDFDADYACGADAPATEPALETPEPDASTPTTAATASATPSLTPTSTATETLTPTATNTLTPTSTPTPSYPAGDANCDRRADATDVALILQRVAGILPVLACQQTSDVNNNGAVDVRDALLILQYVAGLISQI